MNEDDKPDSVGGTMQVSTKPSPKGRPIPEALHDLRNQIALSKGAIQHTVTSSAYTSAEIFNPDQAPQIKAFQEAIAKADKGDVFLLAEGKVSPQQIGITTTLDSDITQPFAGFDLSERQAQADRDHQKDLEDIKNKGSITTEIVRWLLPFILGILATIAGVNIFK